MSDGMNVSNSYDSRLIGLREAISEALRRVAAVERRIAGLGLRVAALEALLAPDAEERGEAALAKAWGAADAAPVDPLADFFANAPTAARGEANVRIERLELALSLMERSLGSINEFVSQSTVQAVIEDARITAYMALEGVSRGKAKDALGLSS